MKLIIRTVDLQTGNTINERLLNMRDKGAWFWINKQIAWACNNQHGLQIVNDIDEPVEQKLAA